MIKKSDGSVRVCKNAHEWDGNRVPIPGSNRTYCRLCRREAARRYYDKMRGTQRFYEMNRWSGILYAYGITKQQWVDMLLRQLGRCAICDENMSKPCVDHDHATGAVRSLLCVGCNTGLGKLEPFMDRVVAYLD